ncbi:hypothetical protein THAOC_30250, partial [Thalassiosira oceanica]
AISPISNLTSDEILWYVTPPRLAGPRCGRCSLGQRLALAPTISLGRSIK